MAAEKKVEEVEERLIFAKVDIGRNLPQVRILAFAPVSEHRVDQTLKVRCPQ